jgi:hypothetical protein
MRTGWLRKEGKGNKAFKRRFFVLWSTSEALLRAGEGLEGKRNATPDDNVLVYYESPGQRVPSELVFLFAVNPDGCAVVTLMCKQTRFLICAACGVVFCRLQNPKGLRPGRERQVDRKATEKETQGRGALYARGSTRLHQGRPVQAGVCPSSPLLAYHSGPMRNRRDSLFLCRKLCP